MIKRTHKGGRVLEIEAEAPATAPTTTQPALQPEPQPAAVDDVYGEYPAETPKALAPKTVVKTAYKHRYQDRAKARGLTDKASRRGNGDWLQRELQAECNDAKGNFDLGRFERILDANGVDYSRWNRTSNGWQGRVRMSGSLVLRGVVGKSGVFRTPDGEQNLVELAAQGDHDAAEFLSKWAN
jgi:hypothetical protein